MPTTSTSGSYNITLYYTNAEVSGYETATSQSWNSAPYVVKADNTISAEYSAPSPTYQLSSSRAVGTYGTSGRWIWGQFSGFSGFAAGAPPPLAWRPSSESEGSAERYRFWAESPFQNLLQLEAEQPFYALQLRNLAGTVVWQAVGPFAAGRYNLHAPNLPTGVYLLEWVEASGETLARQKVLALP